MKKLLVIASMLMFISMFAQAQSTPRVDQRERNQRQRVVQGAKSGELTRKETVASARDQRRIHRSERRAKSDGTVTRQERKKLHREQNRASRHLYRNKHDDQTRPGTH